jgi:hypothetical protein
MLLEEPSLRKKFKLRSDYSAVTGLKIQDLPTGSTAPLMHPNLLYATLMLNYPISYNALIKLINTTV